MPGIPRGHLQSHVIPLLFCVHSQGCRSPPDHFSFLPAWFCVNLSYSHGGMCPLLLSSFSVGLAPPPMHFWCVQAGGSACVILFHHLDLLQLHFLRIVFLHVEFLVSSFSFQLFKHATPELPCWLSDKESPANTGDSGSSLGSGRAPGEENGYPLQYSCLGNPMDRGAQGATVHGVTESQTQQWLNNNNMPLHCLLPLLLRSQLLIALFPWVIFLLLLFDLSLFFHGLPWWLRTVKHLPAIGETWVGSLGREDPLEEETSTPVLLPGKLHGLRSLVGYSPWGHKELGMTE